MALPERAFFDEREERKPTPLTCPRCRHRDDYPVRWIRRTKKPAVPPGADARDRALFAKLRDYLVRVDDAVTCRRCGKRFEIPSHQSVAFF
jgi:DNA-directed RNA polymerase subunit RPC12/RpoP